METTIHETSFKRDGWPSFALLGTILILFGVYVAFSFAEYAYERALSIALEIPPVKIQLTQLQNDIDRLNKTTSQMKNISQAKGAIILSPDQQKKNLDAALAQLRQDDQISAKASSIRLRNADLEAKTSLQSYFFGLYKTSLIVALVAIFLGILIVLQAWAACFRVTRTTHHVKKAAARRASSAV